MMTSSTWRKHMAVWRNRLYLYPAPETMPRGSMFWVATGLVSLLALLFAGYFILYLTGRHDVYITSAEDLGIMDQAIWSATHGHLFLQTICNSVSDTNCYSAAGISRFAIHFEPILFPVSLIYWLFPNPKTLLVLQSLVVASGAFPAFWLARLRLRNELAAVVIAALYLLYPSQQQATVYDFHAVTFTAALLLYTLYFMYTRRTVWLFVFAILSMACKEEIPAVILFFGLWSVLFQHRWRSGLSLAALAVVWIVAEYLIMHAYSPVGHPLLLSRYAALGSNPFQIIRSIVLHPAGILRVYVFEPFHLAYLRILLTPAAYLPLLAPWVLVLAAPSLAINLLSSDPNMHSGYFQYNAEIVPVLIFSTIEAMVLILWLARRVTERVQQERSNVASTASTESASSIEGQPKPSPRERLVLRGVHIVLLVGLLFLVTYNVYRADVVRGAMPFSAVSVDGFQGASPLVTSFRWPQETTHTELAQRFIDMIPANASVSAQSHLVPHVSEREHIYLFPYADDSADYIFLDVTGNTYPLYSHGYITEVKRLLFSGNYGVVAAQDGYLLLKRGLPSPGVSPYSPYSSSSDPFDLLPNLPASFCSFVQVDSQQVQHPLQVNFSSSTDTTTSLNLVGYNAVASSVFSLRQGAMQVATYWTVNSPITTPVQLLTVIVDKNGKNHFATNDFPAVSWCPTNTWQVGSTYSLISDVFLLRGIPNGLAQLSLVLLPVTHPFDTIMDAQSWFTAQVVNAPASIIPVQENRALQLATVSIVP